MKPTLPRDFHFAAVAPTFSLDPTPTSARPRDLFSTLCLERRLEDAVHLLRRQCRLPPHRRSLDLPAAARRLAGAVSSSRLRIGLLLTNRLIDVLAKCGAIQEARNLFDSMPRRDVCSWNTLVAGYSASGNLAEAQVLFETMPERDHFSWSTIISAYSRQGLPVAALDLYRQMQSERRKIGTSNMFTASSALAAAADVPCILHGKEIHGHIVRMGIDLDAALWTALSDMYAECGRNDYARRVFDITTDRDVVSLTAMIGRYFDCGQVLEGFELFSDMLRNGIRPNEFTFAAIFGACSELATEGLGRQVHGHIMRIGYDSSSFAASALVHMYSKCGSIQKARLVFMDMSEPDLVSWTSMISGYAQNGYPEESVRCFDLLLQSGIQPDHVVFVGVLSACAHAGFVDKGLKIFHSIKDEYAFELTADHYACVVDLLSRAGRFAEAQEIMEKMPVKPNKFLWASILGSCRIHKNLTLAKCAAEALIEIEPENAATYITLANIYASAGMWDEVEKIRKLMNSHRAVKKPGSSWIEVKRQIHVFLAGDKSHPRAKEIYAFLEKLSRKIKEVGYVPDTDFVLHDVEHEQKEEILVYHSERLAVAFGIIATPLSVPVKVFKNLRICGDCHAAFKFISKISRRSIIVRDSNRFHHFADGKCSCKDYW